MRQRIGQAALIVLLILCNVGCDQASKRIARACWDDGSTRSLPGDFLNAGNGALRTGIFNLADLSILAGCLILLFHGLRKRGGAA